MKECIYAQVTKSAIVASHNSIYISTYLPISHGYYIVSQVLGTIIYLEQEYLYCPLGVVYSKREDSKMNIIDMVSS